MQGTIQINRNVQRELDKLRDRPRDSGTVFVTIIQVGAPIITGELVDVGTESIVIRDYCEHEVPFTEIVSIGHNLKSFNVHPDQKHP